jgi:hypothetical protein
MSRREEFDDALADLLAEQTTGDDERWPVVAYVLIAVTTDPETMTLEELEIITAENQRDFITRGLIEQGRDYIKADTTAMVSYYTTDEDDD